MLKRLIKVSQFLIEESVLNIEKKAPLSFTFYFKSSREVVETYLTYLKENLNRPLPPKSMLIEGIKIAEPNISNINIIDENSFKFTISGLNILWK